MTDLLRLSLSLSVPVCLSVSLFLSLCLSVSVSVCLPASLCLCVSFCVCLSLFLCVCVSLCLSRCLSVFLSLALCLCPPPPLLSPCLCVSFSVALSVCLSELGSVDGVCVPRPAQQQQWPTAAKEAQYSHETSPAHRQHLLYADLPAVEASDSD